MNRRRFLQATTAAAGTLPTLATAANTLSEAAAPKRLRVICVGAHPDDPESGCGGSLKLYVDEGQEVMAVYLTRGEAGIPGTPHDQAATIRTAECEAACRLLGVQPYFAGQIDAATEITPRAAEAFAELLVKLNPDVVLAQWPLDTHNDHAIAGTLALRTCLSKLPKASLYFYEVYTGFQTLAFHPTDYVDITTTRDLKKRATYEHKSQKPETWYPHHEEMEKFRGAEAQVTAAEAYVRLPLLSKGTPARLLPPTLERLRKP